MMAFGMKWELTKFAFKFLLGFENQQIFFIGKDKKKGMTFGELKTSRTPKIKKEYKKWTLHENLLYIQFLQKNLHPKDKVHRKPRSYFVNMSKHLRGLRTNEQCRSHHRKMLLTHSTILNIIDHVKEKQLSKTSFPDEEFEQFSSNEQVISFLGNRNKKECELKEIPWQNLQIHKDEFQCEQMLLPSIFY